MRPGKPPGVVAAAILAIAACAHEKRPADPAAVSAPPTQRRPSGAPDRGRPVAIPLNRRAMLAMGGVDYEAWIATVRECTRADAARAKAYLPGTQADLARRKPAVSIVGRLMPTTPDTLLIGCDTPCCNGGPFQWVVVPRRGCRIKLRVHLAGSDSYLQGSGMDCAVFGYGAEADWVIVAGQIVGQGDVLVDADLCRLPPAMREAHDQLSDADHERLTAPPTKHRRADDGPGCQPAAG